MTTAPRAGTALNAVNEIVAVVSACARPSAKATEAAVSSLAPTATATLGMAGATLAFAPSSSARRSTVPRPTSSVRTPKGIVVCSAHGAVTSAKRTRAATRPRSAAARRPRQPQQRAAVGGALVRAHIECLGERTGEQRAARRRVGGRGGRRVADDLDGGAAAAIGAGSVK